MKCKHLKNTEQITTTITKNKNGYNILGCCNQGCYTIYGIKYCPFCGKQIISDKK